MSRNFKKRRPSFWFLHRFSTKSHSICCTVVAEPGKQRANSVHKRRITYEGLSPALERLTQQTSRSASALASAGSARSRASMHDPTEDTVLRQLTEAFGNRKYFLISAGVTFMLMLAALVTASKHLNNVRSQAVDPRRRVPYRLKQINSQTTAEGLMHDLAQFNEVLGPRSKAGDKPSTEQSACSHPDCRWVSLYLNNRDQNPADPCTDLYGYACNHQWRGGGEFPFGPRSFRQLAVGTMVANLHSYFNRTSKQNFQDELKGRFLHQPDAIPTIFPNVPKYLSKPVPKKRNPKERLDPQFAPPQKKFRINVASPDTSDEAPTLAANSALPKCHRAVQSVGSNMTSWNESLYHTKCKGLVSGPEKCCIASKYLSS
ncbi:hypothetical protein HPB49_021617 [Dermacentor silvarum]|uniref:Uncharacterized protein n=1 Tax=Dermacentor silvarum TaxID=543639 RepID=A0ACB8C5L2_DERSI|nr:hypothetical protein HPB49_021617 [Dermacentor silvarum]